MKVARNYLLSTLASFSSLARNSPTRRQDRRSGDFSISETVYPVHLSGTFIFARTRAKMSKRIKLS